LAAATAALNSAAVVSGRRDTTSCVACVDMCVCMGGIGGGGGGGGGGAGMQGVHATLQLQGFQGGYGGENRPRLVLTGLVTLTHLSA
jgi:hypothetical protein